MTFNKDALPSLLIILSLFSAAFLIRAAGVPNVWIYWDESWYYYTAIKILASHWVPTTEMFMGSSPFFSHILAAVILVFEGDLDTLRMISVIFGSLTVPLLYLFGKAMYDRKTGLLAALFLCFSAFHCLFSHVIMLEAFTLFFVTAFVYFFWLSQRSEEEPKNMKYAIIAGAMMGLAIAAKYLPFFLVPAILIYSCWTKRFSFKALMDKRIILTLFFALLFLSPLFIFWFTTGGNPVDFYIIERYEKSGAQKEIGIARFEKGVGAEVPALFISPYTIFVRGVEKITEILAWGADLLTPSWRCLFLLSAFLLFVITLFSFLLDFINRKKKGSFLMILLLTLYISIAFTTAARYYLMYSFPFYFVMLSHLAVKSFERLRTRSGKSYKNIFRVFIILLTTIMLFSSFVTAVTSPHWEEGDLLWAKRAVEFIKKDVAKSGPAGDIVIGWPVPGREKELNYCIYLSDLNASTTCIVKPGSKYGEIVKIDLEKIGRLKPNYLIISESEYDVFFKPNDKKEIFKDYRIIFHSKTPYPYNCFVFKKKNMQPPELLSQMDCRDGKISKDIFNRSIPSVMKVGGVYTALVQVKNRGDSRRDFYINVYSEIYTISMEEEERSVTLNKGSTHIFKFKIVPIREYAGELPITVDLYAKYEENGTWRRVDSCSDHVYLIKR